MKKQLVVDIFKQGFLSGLSCELENIYSGADLSSGHKYGAGTSFGLLYYSISHLLDAETHAEIRSIIEEEAPLTSKKINSYLTNIGGDYMTSYETAVYKVEEELSGEYL